MTQITAPIKRQLPLKDRSRFVVAEISEDGIEFRRKGTQETYEVPWGVMYDCARRFASAARGVTVPVSRRRRTR
jgi:hypothetical protein